MVDSYMTTNEKPVQYIFHLARKEGTPSFCHPFPSQAKFIETVVSSRIVGLYGEEPRVESLSLLRNDLYRRMETALKLWILDLKFVPRFLLAAGTFLLVYFFMSYVIRDPLPMIDELLFGLGGAAGVYYLLGRRYLDSDLVSGKRIELRTAVDGIAFAESEFVRKIESILGSYEDADTAEQLRIYGSREKLALDPAWREEALALHRCLDALFSGRDVRVFRKKLQNKVTASARRPLDKLRKLIDGKKIDFPLFLLYAALHRGLE